jgi:hypothetical protein
MSTRHRTQHNTGFDTDLNTGSNDTTNRYTARRSTEMQTMHEALAREHMRRREQEARRHSLSSELASANRWRYLERRAHAAYRRHAQRAHRAAQVSAVAE